MGIKLRNVALHLNINDRPIQAAIAFQPCLKPSFNFLASSGVDIFPCPGSEARYPDQIQHGHFVLTSFLDGLFPFLKHFPSLR